MQTINIKKLNIKEYNAMHKFYVASFIVGIIELPFIIGHSYLPDQYKEPVFILDHLLLLSLLIMAFLGRHNAKKLYLRLADERWLLDHLDMIIDNTLYKGKQCDLVRGKFIKNRQSVFWIIDGIEQICCSNKGNWFKLWSRPYNLFTFGIELTPISEHDAQIELQDDSNLYRAHFGEPVHV